MKYLGYQQCLAIYRRVMEATSGSGALRDRGLLEAALARPRASFGGEDLYPTLFDKAAALCHSITKNHPFTDGNKRVAYESTKIFLLMNGYRIHGSEDEKFKFVISIAEGLLDVPEISVWLKDKTQPIR